MEQGKIGIGVILLAVSSVFLFLVGGFDATFRVALAVWAAVGLAVGSLLLGIAKSGRPV